jgi:hypothetical protein
MVDFAKLKSMSGKKGLETLTAELNKISNQENPKKGDDRFWQPTVDKAGNGYAVIRFIPAPENEDIPFVRIFDHGFQGPTGLWYIENSLTTLGKPDPVSEFNSKLWNSTTSDESPERKQVRKQKRRLHYISNIYVIQDSGNLDNDGKVFLYKYGKKIFDKLNEAMNPQFADEEAINPFDFWNGASFKLKIRNVDGYRNYDKSEFGKSEALFDDDKKIESIWKKEYSLKSFLEPSNFKSYDELKAKLSKVLDENIAPVARAETKKLEEAPAPTFKSYNEPVSMSEDSDGDDDIAYFKMLAS